MQCPNCSKENSDKSRFCQFCGGPLTPVGPQYPPTAVYNPPANPPAQNYQQPQQVQPYRPPAGAYQSPVAPPIGQLGSGGSSAGSIWGPFAGYGSRGRHASWVLDNLGDRAEALHQAVSTRFEQRKVPNARMRWVQLTGKGILVERRPFYFIERGIATVAIYIARFGQDLYISQVTYAKGPINPLRVAIIALMILFQLFYSFGYGPAVEATLPSFDFFGSSGGSTAALLFLLCVAGPVGLINALLLGFVLLFSGYKWLTERDFLAILRTPPNEFELDDINALEKSVEETVRQSLDAIGINSNLMPPAPEQSFHRPRLI